MAALHHEFNVVPTTNGTYPRHTMPELAYALDTVAKGDLRMAVAYLTEEGAPTWGATTIQARVRGNCAREELKHRHAAAVVIQTRARGIQGRVKGAQYMKEVRAARRIQARQRGNTQRHRLVQEQAAALKIQTSARGHAARVEKVCRREKKHATVLQQLCRRQLARQQLQKQTAAGQRVQCVFRGWRVRRIIAALNAETHKYTVLKKVTAQCAADEKSKKVSSSEGSVFQPGERVMNTIESKSILLKGSTVSVQRIKVNLSSGSQGWLSVSDKKGNTLMEPIHRWLVREQSTTQAGAGGKPQVMEGTLKSHKARRYDSVTMVVVRVRATGGTLRCSGAVATVRRCPTKTLGLASRLHMCGHPEHCVRPVKDSATAVQRPVWQIAPTRNHYSATAGAGGGMCDRLRSNGWLNVCREYGQVRYTHKCKSEFSASAECLQRV